MPIPSAAIIHRGGSRFDDPAAFYCNIELLRFVAACAILLGHMAPHVWAAGGQESGWIKAVWYVAGAGPDIFFVISGTVIWTASYGAYGRREALRFMLRRLIRVFSVYWVFLLLTAIQLWYWAPLLLAHKDWLRSLFLWPQDIDTQVIPVAWTLTHVLVFYLLMTMLIWLRDRSRAYTLIAAAILVLIGTVYSSMVLEVYSEAKLTAASWLWRLWLSPYQLEFIGGCLIAHILRNKTLPKPGLMLLAGVILITLGCWINANVFDGRLISGYYTPQRVAIFAPGALLLVAGCIGLQQAGHAPWPRTAALLGAGTYTLYLLHSIALGWLYRIGLRDALANTDLLVPVYLLFAALLVMLALLYARDVEGPMNLHLFRQVDRRLNLHNK